MELGGIAVPHLLSSARHDCVVDDVTLAAEISQFLTVNPAVPGCVVYRIDRDNAACVAAGGIADPGTQRPMSIDATFRIASCTKTFTAAAVLRLVEEDVLGLDDLAVGFLPRDKIARLSLGSITVRDLLQHTSGLPDIETQEFLEELYRSPSKVWTPWEKIERSLIGRERQWPPGAEARYCDVGYILLAMLIETLTAEPLPAALRRLANLDALGLRTIHLERLEPTPSNAGPRVRHFVGTRDVTEIHPSCDLWGAGGLVSDAHDLAHWWHALFAGQVLRSDASFARMRETVPEPSAARDMGLGMYKRTLQDQPIWSHGGFWGTYAAHSETTGTTIAVLLNQCLDEVGPGLRELTVQLLS